MHLPTFYIGYMVPVRFSRATYPVTEGVNFVAITLEALASHAFPLVVHVSTQDGNAHCECVMH